jgi:protoheme IX farnesyltransferase
MIAGALGVLVLTLALLAARRRRYGVAQVIVASTLVALAIPALHARPARIGVGLAILGEAILLFAALRWSNLDLARNATLTLAVIIFQALLGMWTVTWLLKPIVVMGHLLGGLLTFSLLLWTAWRATDLPIRLAEAQTLRKFVIVGLVLLGRADRIGRLDQLPTMPRWPAATTSRPASAAGGRRTISARASCSGAASASTTRAASSTARRASPSSSAHRLMAVVVFFYLLWFALRLLRTAGHPQLGGVAGLADAGAGRAGHRQRQAGPAPVGGGDAQRGARSCFCSSWSRCWRACARLNIDGDRREPSHLPPILRPDQAARGRADRVYRAGRHVPGGGRPADGRGNRRGILGFLGIWLAASRAPRSTSCWIRASTRRWRARRGARSSPGRSRRRRRWCFALILAALSMLVLVLWVNTITAVLTFASLIGYAVIYTVFLKRATPQNIVIGGIAGAAPPLLGWASITGMQGEWDWPHALLLVLIIFVWTPPHFWALAIFRRADYARAMVPMLPVTHGVEYTRWQILFYTVLLVAVTVLPWAAGMSGLFYLGGALVLGAVFLGYAWKLMNPPDELYAMKVFNYSIVYLMALFAFLLLDHWMLPWFQPSPAFTLQPAA